MELSIVTLIVVSIFGGLVVALAVNFVSARILQGQKELKEAVQTMAGLRKVRRLVFGSSTSTLSDLLQGRRPTRSLLILGNTGSVAVRGDDNFLVDMLRTGVRVNILLLDPASHNWLFEVCPECRNELTESLVALNNIFRQSGPKQYDLNVKLYVSPPFESLVFVDDDYLFLFRGFPRGVAGRLVYEIEPGPESLYELYREAYEFLWEASKVFAFGAV